MPSKEDAKVIDKNQLSSSCPTAFTYQVPFRKALIPNSKTQIQPSARPRRSHSYQLFNFLEGKRNQGFLFNINFSTTHLHLSNSSGLHIDWLRWMLAVLEVLTSLSIPGKLRGISVLQSFLNMSPGFSKPARGFESYTAAAPQLLKFVCPNTSPTPPPFLSCCKSFLSCQISPLKKKATPIGFTPDFTAGCFFSCREASHTRPLSH